MEDAVAGADMGQEGISQALASVSTFHQASNVNYIKEGWDFATTQEVKGRKVSHLRHRNSSHRAAIQHKYCKKLYICKNGTDLCQITTSNYSLKMCHRVRGQ